MKTATATDHIPTNSFVDTDFKSVIFKTDISDHFPVCLLLPLPSIAKSENEATFIYKRTFSSDSIEMFKQKLYKINLEEFETNQNPNEAYGIFQEKIRLLHNQFFPKKKIVISKKDLKSPWITTEIKKSSKRKQRLYGKFLKN